MIRLLLTFTLLASPAFGKESIPGLKSPEAMSKWPSLSQNYRKEKARDKRLGWSYVISGGIGFLGGFAGQEVAKDPLEKGAYTVFQSIGIAAVGYGLYKIYLGSEEQRFFELLESSAASVAEKERLYDAFLNQQKDLLIKENRIRALTHGLIAALNIYNASQQTAGVIRDSLYFIGGVNLLASASYSFEF